MHRRSKKLNAPLEVQENESRYTEEKEEAFFPDLSRDQKICKATKEKKASKKENLSDGNLVGLQNTLKHTKGKDLYPSKEDAVSSQVPECFFGALKGGGVGEQALPLNSQENFSRSKPVSLNECYLAPKRDKAEEKSGCATSEEQRKKPVDFATVTIAEFGITPESFTKRPIGKSPTSLKYRRRSSIGAQGSPEHNTLIQYLAQQRSNRQKEAFTWLSPFRHETLRSLKNKIDAFQTSFTSVEEVEETDFGFSGLSQVDDASQGAGSYFSSDHITEGVRRNALSDPNRDKVSLVEEQSLEMPDESKASVTPPITSSQTGNNSLNKCTPNGSHLRPALKKTPKQHPVDGMEECSSGAVGRGGGESPAVSSSAEISEALHTENTERHSSEMPKKKRVTFGEVLSPEIFDENLPANTPLRRGAAPVPPPGSHSSSPSARLTLTEEPLSQPNFDCSDECIEPLQELVEGPVAAKATSPVENAEAETDKSVIKTRSSTKRKHSTVSEGADLTISKATNTRNAKDIKNQKKSKFQRQKNTATSAAKKTQKTKHTNYGKRRKKKVKKSLYGEREMASKKPLLSPIPEIPEVFSSASSPNSPEADVLFSGNTKSGNADKDVLQKPVTERRGQTSFAVPMDSTSKDLKIVEVNSSSDGAVQMSGDLKTVSDMDHKFSNVPGFLQQGKETVDVKEAEESGSLTENEKIKANLLLEQLTGLEFLDQDIYVHEGAQITQSPQEGSIKVSPARRRRRSSSIYFPPVEKIEITGNNFPVPFFNVEEVLSISQLKNDSLESFRRQSGNTGEKRVRRSMRFLKEGAAEGLAWIQVPNEIQKDLPIPASARKIQRTISTSILSESENIQPREQNLAQCSAPGKEKKDSGPLTDGPCKRWRRRSICVSTPQETGTWSQTQKRSLNSVYRKSRGNQKHYEEVEIPLENNS
ncbi:cell division cycle-associated protein 2 [Phaethornis superciliosus]